MLKLYWFFFNNVATLSEASSVDGRKSTVICFYKSAVLPIIVLEHIYNSYRISEFPGVA